jgi:hypothetical protein
LFLFLKIFDAKMQYAINQATTTNWTHAVFSGFKEQTKLFLKVELTCQFWWSVEQNPQLQINTTGNAAQFRKTQQANMFHF